MIARSKGGKSVSLELREHYVFSPEYAVYGNAGEWPERGIRG